MAQKFAFSLVAPEGEFFADEVELVVAPGAEGDFGVMAAHAPFMTLLRPGIVRAEKDVIATRIFVHGGFAEITPARMTVLAEEAIDLAGIDEGALSTEIRGLGEELKGITDPVHRAGIEARAARLEALRGAIAGQRH